MKSIRILLCAFCCITIAGCMSARVNLRDSGTLQVKFDVPKDISLTAVPYESDGNLIVLGRVARSPLSTADVKGHVDIKIINPKGELVSEWQVHLRRLPAIRHTSNPGSFSFSIPGVPPEGSVVEVKYDNSAHEHSEKSIQ